MNPTYPLILFAVLALSPFILKLASNQSKKAKEKLKYFFILILHIQILLGFFNWETFRGPGRTGFGLSLAFPESALGLFFLISALQIILLFFSKSLNILIVSLNFITSVIIFISMIRMSNFLGHQIVSFASIGAAFLVLTGNVIALALINKDKNLLKKYLRS